MGRTTTEPIPQTMKITLVIPVLNEIDGMKVILPRIQKDWVDEIIVVDGGSTDGSLEYAESLGFQVLRQKSKRLANAYWEMLEIATGDVIIPFSPDGNSIPERIPDLVSKVREGYDMVTVSRYLNGARSQDDSPVTGFGNWFCTKIINLLFKTHYTDTLVMYRAWKRSIVEPLKIDPVSGFEPRLCIECAKRNLKVTEIPGDEPKRIGGQTKRQTLYGAAKITALILKEWFAFIRQPRSNQTVSETPSSKEEVFTRTGSHS